jgi:hypothetical protein
VFRAQTQIIDHLMMQGMVSYPGLYTAPLLVMRPCCSDYIKEVASTTLNTLLDLLTTQTCQRSDTRWASHPLLLPVCPRKILQPMRRPPVVRLCRIFQEAFHIAKLGAQQASYRLTLLWLSGGTGNEWWQSVRESFLRYPEDGEKTSTGCLTRRPGVRLEPFRYSDGLQGSFQQISTTPMWKWLQCVFKAGLHISALASTF